MFRLSRKIIFFIVICFCVLSTITGQESDSEAIQHKNFNEDGVHGKLYYKANSDKSPTIIVLSGSGGGIGYSEQFGEPLAKEGFTVFALPYWKYKNLPEKLSEIPLEYFYKAIDVLRENTHVDPDKIGMIGYSRGGELALLLASKSTDIKAVLGLSAGAYVAPNINFKNWWNLKSAWTENGAGLDFLPKKRKVKRNNWKEVFKNIKANRNRDSLIANFQDIKRHPEFEKSAIKVENMRAPLLLISGGRDLTWSSESMSDYIINRLHDKAYKYFNAHLNFPLAGHDFVPLGFNDRLSQEDLIEKYENAEYRPGGTVEHNISAGKRSWKHILRFLNLHLKNK